MPEHTSKLYGTWRLVSLETEQKVSHERSQPWGPDPNGYLILTADGWMMTLVTAKAREPGDTDEKLSGLFRTMMAYAGRYRIDGDKLIIQVDASWNEAFNGSDQVRFYALDGDTLDLASPWMPNPLDPRKSMGRGILRFTRE